MLNELLNYCTIYPQTFYYLGLKCHVGVTMSVFDYSQAIERTSGDPDDVPAERLRWYEDVLGIHDRDVSVGDRLEEFRAYVGDFL